MAISKRARDLTDNIYQVFGSSTGHLFGLKPDRRGSVEAIVQCVLDQTGRPLPDAIARATEEYNYAVWELTRAREKCDDAWRELVSARQDYAAEMERREDGGKTNLRRAESMGNSGSALRSR